MARFPAPTTAAAAAADLAQDANARLLPFIATPTMLPTLSAADAAAADAAGGAGERLLCRVSCSCHEAHKARDQMALIDLWAQQQQQQ